jgi:hypothetical protein
VDWVRFAKNSAFLLKIGAFFEPAARKFLDLPVIWITLREELPTTHPNRKILAVFGSQTVAQARHCGMGSQV